MATNKVVTKKTLADDLAVKFDDKEGCCRSSKLH